LIAHCCLKKEQIETHLGKWRNPSQYSNNIC
jgi:hypothetical protein